MFFNKNLYKQISNCKHTTKQAITYFLLGYYNTKRINTDSIIKSIVKSYWKHSKNSSQGKIVSRDE